MTFYKQIVQIECDISLGLQNKTTPCTGENPENSINVEQPWLTSRLNIGLKYISSC